MQLSTRLARFLLVADYATSPPAKENLNTLRFMHRSIKPDDKAVNCRQEFKTDVWTGCDDVLAQFDLKLEEFKLANPTIGDKCDGFVPGETYCVG
jgi:hypothetical protein